MNAPRPEASDNDTQANLGKFSRIASGGSFVMSGVVSGTSDAFPPSRITDLDAKLNDEDEFHFSWTAPGNDYDKGKGNIFFPMLGRRNIAKGGTKYYLLLAPKLNSLWNFPYQIKLGECNLIYHTHNAFGLNEMPLP